MASQSIQHGLFRRVGLRRVYRHADGVGRHRRLLQVLRRKAENYDGKRFLEISYIITLSLRP